MQFSRGLEGVLNSVHSVHLFESVGHELSQAMSVKSVYLGLVLLWAKD